MRGSADPKADLSPGLKVGAWTEMLSTIERDYVLRSECATASATGVGDHRPLREDRREQVVQESKRVSGQCCIPSRVKVAIASEARSGDGFRPRPARSYRVLERSRVAGETAEPMRRTNKDA